MADDLLDGLIGADESEASGDKRAASQAQAEAFAAVVAARLSAGDKGVARATETFLKKQARLIDLQATELEDEHGLEMTQLHAELREGRLRRIGQRMRISLQVFTALILTAIGLGLLVMILDAFSSRDVIVDPFDAPPALASRGLTGKVVAGGVLDELSRLQAATRSSAAKRSLSNAWTSDIKIEVPETGVSLGEIDRLLKARFGHDIHINGDLVQTGTGGLALTVRGDGVLPRTFTGAADDLAKLNSQAAEYVYGQSQPGLFAAFLIQAGRNAEAVAFARSAYATSPLGERPYILNSWANALVNVGGSQVEALALYRQALKLKPDYWVAYNNLMNAAWALGDEEGAWRTGEAMRKAAGGRPGRAPELYYQNWDTLTWNLQAQRAGLVADALANGGVGTGISSNGTSIAEIDAKAHDPTSAEFQLQTVRGDATDPSVAAMSHFARGLIALDARDGARAAAEMEAFAKGYEDPIVSSSFPGYPCWIAPAEELAGYPDKADAALAAGGRHLDCYRFRGDILDGRGDRAGAERAYAAAAALAPDLPGAYYSWGASRARHGDLAGAEAKFAEANRRGPHWADPLKAWGDVLARQGRWKEARAKYDEALKYAPAWSALRSAKAVADAHR